MRGARGRFGGLGPLPGVVSFPFPPSRPAFPALFVAGRPVRMSLTLARWYAIPCGLCVPRARSGCPSGFPCVSFVCVCARATVASAPPPPSPRWCGARTSRGPGAGRWLGRSTWSVPLRVSCPGPVPRLVFLGAAGPVSPLPGSGLCASPGVGLRICAGVGAGALVACGPVGGVEGGRARGPQAWGASEGERGGGAAPLLPTFLPWGGGPWPPSLSSFFSVAPPLGIHAQLGWLGGRRRRARPGRPPVSQCSEGGGRRLLAMVCSPALPRRAPRRAVSSAHSSVPPFSCCPRRRRGAAGRQRVMRE